MFDVVIVHPEIPPNTGNAIRLCANTGARLHLVEPLGFLIGDKQLRRAGLDYHEFVQMHVHSTWDACVSELAGKRMFAFTRGASLRYDTVAFEENDVLVFGGETSGLPPDVLNAFTSERQLRLPMRPGNRSVNLSNSIAVVVFEAWRQQGFRGAEGIETVV